MCRAQDPLRRPVRPIRSDAGLPATVQQLLEQESKPLCVPHESVPTAAVQKRNRNDPCLISAVENAESVLRANYRGEMQRRRAKTGHLSRSGTTGAECPGFGQPVALLLGGYQGVGLGQRLHSSGRSRSKEPPDRNIGTWK
jgi:hypothetical protein